MESKVKRENFILIQGWMVTDLNLKGNELLIYACIYGFSQAENQVFNGSLQYLADWTNSSKRTVISVLQSLEDKNLITKRENYINGVKFCEYFINNFTSSEKISPVVKNLQEGGEKSSLGGGEKISPYNIYKDNIDNNIERKKESKKESTYDEIIDKNFQKEEVKDTLREFIKMRKLIKKPLTNYGLMKICNRLKELSDNQNEQVEILNQSIINNWQGIFPLNENFQPKQEPKNQELKGLAKYQL